MSDPRYAHRFVPNREGFCKQIVGYEICHEREDAPVHRNQGADEMSMSPEEREKMREINARLRELLEDLVHQFAYELDDPPRLSTGGLSVLEHAFETLGWEDPHPIPFRCCDEPGCTKIAHCGWPDPNGGKYRWTCRVHVPESIMGKRTPEPD